MQFKKNRAILAVVVAAAMDLAEQFPGKNIVAVIPDSGERYLSVW